MTTNEQPDFWGLYWYTERFLSDFPVNDNVLDIYDKIEREREEEELAEFYSYCDYDIDDLNNRDLLDDYDYTNEILTEVDNHKDTSDDSDEDDFVEV